MNPGPRIEQIDFVNGGLAVMSFSDGKIAFCSAEFLYSNAIKEEQVIDGHDVTMTDSKQAVPSEGPANRLTT